MIPGEKPDIANHLFKYDSQLIIGNKPEVR